MKNLIQTPLPGWFYCSDVEVPLSRINFSGMVGCMACLGNGLCGGIQAISG